MNYQNYEKLIDQYQKQINFEKLIEDTTDEYDYSDEEILEIIAPDEYTKYILN